MTKPFNYGAIWPGSTVAVMASGPSMSAAIAEALRPCRRIVVNYTHLLAPDAEMLVALDLDPAMWASARDFAGLRLCGVASDDLDAHYVGPMFERITMAPGHIIETCNSGLAAIRIAARMGAKRIILAGFDPDIEAHFDGRPNREIEAAPSRYVGLAEGLAALIAELRAQGIEVERYSDDLMIAPVEVVKPVRKRKAA